MRIGVDLGGTKIEAIALAEDGKEIVRHRVASPRGHYSETLEAIAAIVADVERSAGRSGTVGVGMPGTISPATGLVKNANSTWLNGRPLAEDLPRRLGRPVRFANDANCFALSEATDGAAAGAAVVFGVIIGTGTGGGVVVNGRVVVGANAIAGEWGHNPLPTGGQTRGRTRGQTPSLSPSLAPSLAPGLAPSSDEVEEDCYCGRRGCIEQFLSGPALSRDYGGNFSAREIADRARGGEPLARAVLDRYADRLARALGTVINVLDPDVIVLGGGLSNIEMLYEVVPARWTRYIFSDHVATRLVRAQHGDSSGVRGAAWLWDSTGP